MTDRGTIGMALLSGPAPPAQDPCADICCRKCNKGFNFLFTRARKCNHCGHSYCSSCSSYQALIAREGFGSGYDPVHVCAFCIENLTITAGGHNYLQGLELARLNKYVNAYNITTDRVLEKDELIKIIIAARGEKGYLPESNESFYRMHSIPNGRIGTPRGFFSWREEPQPVQPTPPRQQPVNPFLRPDLKTPRHPISPPTLDELLNMTDEEISKMSISALRTVLSQNRVVNARQLEISDLVERVRALLNNERQERAREAATHAREEEVNAPRQVLRLM